MERNELLRLGGEGEGKYNPRVHAWRMRSLFHRVKIFYVDPTQSFDILCDGAVGQHRHCTEVSIQKGFNFLTEKFKAKAVHVLMERANCFKVFFSLRLPTIMCIAPPHTN